MNPNQVPINLTLNLDQINLILESLGKMPHERVAEFVVGLRAETLRQLKAAEEAALAEARAAEAQQQIELPASDQPVQ